MFNITPLVLAVLAVTASKEGSNDITRRLLGGDYNNDYGGFGAIQGGEEGGVDVSGSDNGLMMEAQDGDDDNRGNGFMMMAQNGEDNGLESRHGGYGRRNDYYKRDYYDKPYYPRYRATEGGESDGAAFSMMMANEGGNPDDVASAFALMDGEAEDDNRIALASRYGGYRRNNNDGYNGYNGYRRNYYKNNGYGPYWAIEGGDAEMDSFSIPKPIDDDAPDGVFMANKGGNPEDGARPWSLSGEEAGYGDDNNGLGLASRYGRYGRNDYYRNNRYDRYYRNGRNNYYNGYDKFYRNRYNDGYRYRATEGGEFDGDASRMLANQGGNPQVGFSCPECDIFGISNGEAGDDNNILASGMPANQGGKPMEVNNLDRTDYDPLPARYGRYTPNDYYRNNKYDGYYRNRGNDYYNGYGKQYRNRYNDGYRYPATEGGQSDGDAFVMMATEGGNPDGAAAWAMMDRAMMDGAMMDGEAGDNNKYD